jgi:hypothetical protein
MFTIKSEVVGRPPIMSDGLLPSVHQQICERRQFTISKIACEFSKISPSVLCKFIRDRLGYHKFCGTCVPKMLTGANRMASTLTYLERYHKDGDEFHNHIVRVIGDETWVSFVCVKVQAVEA